MRIVALLCLALFACDDGGGDAVDSGAGGVGGEGGGAGGAGGEGGEGGGMPAFDVVLSEDDALIPVDDGATVGFEWGFQGGTMIRPAVVLPRALVDGLDEVRLRLRYRPDPDDPAAFGDIGNFPPLVLDLPIDPYDAEHVIVGPVDNQIGWVDLDGARFILDVTVTAPDVRVERSLRLTIEGQAGPCDVYPQHGMGCIYRDVAGQFVVLRHEPAPDCPNAVLAMTEFQPTDDAGLACFDGLGLTALATRVLPWQGLNGGADPECLANLGLGPNGSAPGILEIQENGGCSPVIFVPDVDASACALCP